MKFRKTLLLFCLLSLGGCSAFSLLFDRLDWLVVWRLDSMYELNEAQEEVAEEGALAMQAWLSQEAFPLWVERLENARLLWNEQQHPAAYEALRSGFDKAVNEFLEAVRPHVIRFALTLNDDNAAHFWAYNQEQQAEWFDYAHSQEAKISKRTERLEDWFGSLDNAQRALVAEHIRLYPDEHRIRVANNTQWNELMLSAALSRDTQALEIWLTEPSVWWTDEYKALRQFNRNALDQLLLALFPTLHEEQKAEVSDKVGDWIEDLSEVIP